MKINLKKFLSPKLFFLVVSSVLVGVFFALFWVSKNNQKNDDLSQYPVNEIPLQEIEKAPKNYYFTCTLRKIVTKEVDIKQLNGELFGLCDYKTGIEIREVAILLGFVDKTKGTTFMFGDQFGESKIIFESNAFPALAEQAGFTKGKNLAIVITSVGHPVNNDGVMGIEVLGDDLDMLYPEQDAFGRFVRTGDPLELPSFGKIEGAPILLPVSIH